MGRDLASVCCATGREAQIVWKEVGSPRRPNQPAGRGEAGACLCDVGVLGGTEAATHASALVAVAARGGSRGLIRVCWGGALSLISRIADGACRSRDSHADSQWRGPHAWQCRWVVAWPPRCEDERDSSERWPCQLATCMVFEPVSWPPAWSLSHWLPAVSRVP